MNLKNLIWSFALVLLSGATSQLLAQAAPPAKPAASPAAGTAPAMPVQIAPPPTGDVGPTAYTDMPSVDMSKLSDAQKKQALKIMNEEKCTCGCGFTIAGCRHKDQKCPISPGLAKGVVDDLLANVADADIRKKFAAKPAAAAAAPQPPLDTKANNFDLSTAPIKGPKDAKVTIVEFSDFQCPFCSQATAWAEEILKAYPKDVKLAFKHYPLPFHNQAHLAAQAAVAAQQQGKFWEMHDKMFANFRTLNPDNIKGWAKEVGVDPVAFNKAIDGATYKARVDKEMKEGSDAGVQGTPTFFVNGKKYNGQRDLPSIKKIIDEELKGGGTKAADASSAPVKKATPAQTDTVKKTGSDK